MSPTPKSDPAIAKFEEFTKRIRARLEDGRATYGDSSFTQSLSELTEQIRQEVLDIVGWSFITYVRLAEIEERCRQLEKRLADLEQ